MARPARSGKRIRDGLLVIMGVALLTCAAWFVLQEWWGQPVQLRMTAGQQGGTRHRIALELAGEAAQRAITIELRATAGSEEALRELDSGRVDVALMQGGLDMVDHPGLRQVAVMPLEPLHLLVKEEIHQAVARNLSGLRGKVVNLGDRGSGTYLLAREVMVFSKLRAGIDYKEKNETYADLERETDRSRLPDAIFSVSTLPSPIASHMVTKHQYRLVSLPYSEAFTLWALHPDRTQGSSPGEAATRIDRRHVYDATIPAFAYEIEPGVPPEDIHTLGTRLLLVARRDVAATTIRRLLEVVYDSPFARILPSPPDAGLFDLPPELPWHDGKSEYVRRNSPLIAGDLIDLFEKEVSIFGVLAGGLFCLVQWVRRRYHWRRERSFEAYILQIAGVERRALALSRAPTLDLAALVLLQEDLTRIKGEALERFADGHLDGEILMSGFLTHASDARDFLGRLILHQRDNLEDEARTQHRSAEVLWNEALGELRHPAPDIAIVNRRGVVPVPRSPGYPLEECVAEADEPVGRSIQHCRM